MTSEDSKENYQLACNIMESVIHGLHMNNLEIKKVVNSPEKSLKTFLEVNELKIC